MGFLDLIPTQQECRGIQNHEECIAKKLLKTTFMFCYSNKLSRLTRQKFPNCFPKNQPPFVIIKLI